MYKLDLHTHSIASPDGGVRPDQYRQLLTSQKFDFIAITDHDRLDLALQLHQELGHCIIVGQEITTRQGELIGLFLQERIRPGQTARASAQAIKSQGGVVYVPHPFETVRQGMTAATLQQIADLVDLVEVHNGRAVFQNRSATARAWVEQHHKIGVASSDAHGLAGLGYTYTTVSQPLTRQNCLAVLAQAQLTHQRPPLVSLLYPKYHRLRRRLRGGS